MIYIFYVMTMPTKPKWENTTVEQLQSEVSDLEKLLNELKTKTFSDAEREKKEKDAKSKAEKLKWQIDKLSKQEWIDPKLAEEREKAKVLLESYEKTLGLKSSIEDKSSEWSKSDSKENSNSPASTEKAQTSTQTETENPAAVWEEKWFFWKTWDWTKEQWNDVRSWDKRKEEPWTNLLRTTWFIATWVWAAALAYKWIKKLWNRAFWDNDEDNSEEDEETETKSKKKKKKSSWETSWRKKWLLWAWWIAWTVLWWSVIYKNRPAIKARFKEKLWNGLTMEQSVVSATAEVRAWHEIDEDIFRHNFEDWIQYDAQKKTIKSYWYETPIDPVWKKLVWLDNVVFSDYKELIHAANITNCLKSNYHNRCDSPEPFHPTNWWWWDLEITLANWDQPEVISASDTNARAWIGWVWWAAVWWFLWAYCGSVPWALWWAAGWAAAGAIGWNYLDNNSSMWHTVSTIASWNNFQKYIYYLNIQKSADGKSLRPHENEQIRTDTPLKEAWKEVLNEILWTYSDNWDDYNRNIDIKQDEKDPTHFTIESYNEKVPLVIEWLTLTSENKIDYGKIKSIKIWKYKEYDRWNGLDMDFSHDKDGLKEAIKVANLTNKIRHDFRDKWGEQFPFGVKVYGYHRHLQIDDRGYRWRDVVYRETLSSKFPTLWQDLKQQINETDQKKLRKQAHGNSDQEWCWSKYIRYLHQMREQRWALSYWRHEND